MNPNIPIRHDQIAAYVQGKPSRLTQKVIEKLRRDNPAYDALFDLINMIRSRQGTQKVSGAPSKALTFDEMEQLLLKLFSGDVAPEAEWMFLNQLGTSPVFYHWLMEKLQVIAPRVEFEPVDEIANNVVSVRSNAEIIHSIKAQFGVVQSEPAAAQEGIFSAILEKMQQLKSNIRRLPGYGVAIPALATLLLVSYLFLRGFMENSIPGYNWDKQVPFQTSGIELRGSEALPEMNLSSTALEAVNDYQHLKDVLSLSLGSYLRTDYRQMIQTLNNGFGSLALLHQKLPEIQQEIARQDPELLRDIQLLVQKYYFYAGVGYMAYSQSQREKLDDGKREEARFKAVTFLSRAKEFGQKYGIETSQREDYFLGLTYILMKDFETARKVLRNISQDSNYHADAQKLLKQISH